MTNIGGSAFQGCYRLTSITIPSSVTNINGSAFAGCSRLEYNVDEYVVSYLGNNDTPYVYLADAPTTLTSYTIKNTCKAIGDSAFRGCSRLTSITIPESVTSIGDIAFMGCSGLATIALNTPYSWMISESDVTNSITLTASQVQTNALAYLTSDYLYYQWQALV